MNRLQYAYITLTDFIVYFQRVTWYFERCLLGLVYWDWSLNILKVLNYINIRYVGRVGGPTKFKVFLKQSTHHIRYSSEVVSF